jgi:P27 family predicted phage terminase small subunit
MGRKRIRNEVKKLTGARIRDEHVAQEAVRPPPGRPTPPDAVRQDPEALAEWKRICPLLEEMRILSKASRAAIAMYVLAWSNVHALALKVAADKRAAVDAGQLAADGLLITRPSGIVRPSAAMQALAEAMATCASRLGDLGLSPSTVSRVLATRSADQQLDLPGVADPVAIKLAALGGKRVGG